MGDQSCLADKTFLWFSRETKKFPPLSQEEIETLFIKAQQGDIESRNRILEANIGIILKIVCQKFLGYTEKGVDIKDMTQAGVFGLFESIKGFDFTKGYTFSTYATLPIVKAIFREIFNFGYAVHIPVNVADECRKVKIAKGCSVEELIKETGLNRTTIEKVSQLEKLLTPAISLDKDKIDENNDETPSTEEEVLKNERMNAIMTVLNDRVQGRDRKIFLYRLVNPKYYTLEVLGKKYGLTREAVRLIEQKILKIVRGNRTIQDLTQI